VAMTSCTDTAQARRLLIWTQASLTVNVYITACGSGRLPNQVQKRAFVVDGDVSCAADIAQNIQDKLQTTYGVSAR